MLFEIAKILKDNGSVSKTDLKKLNQNYENLNTEDEVSSMTPEQKIKWADKSLNILSEILEN
jgi:hypothetical protein